MQDWQTWAAPAVVLLTLALFARRAVLRRRGQNKRCGRGCGCGPRE